jgi:hypothetical protein
MTSFFYFFLGTGVGHIVFGEADPPLNAKVERVVLNALANRSGFGA